MTAALQAQARRITASLWSPWRTSIWTTAWLTHHQKRCYEANNPKLEADTWISRLFFFPLGKGQGWTLYVNYYALSDHYTYSSFPIRGGLGLSPATACHTQWLISNCIFDRFSNPQITPAVRSMKEPTTQLKTCCLRLMAFTVCTRQPQPCQTVNQRRPPLS